MSPGSIFNTDNAMLTDDYEAVEMIQTDIWQSWIQLGHCVRNTGWTKI